MKKKALKARGQRLHGERTRISGAFVDEEKRALRAAEDRLKEAQRLVAATNLKPGIVVLTQDDHRGVVRKVLSKGQVLVKLDGFAQVKNYAASSLSRVHTQNTGP